MSADRARTLVGLAVAVLALFWACADFDSLLDPTGGIPDVVVADPSFSRDIQPIFTARCATGGCHTAASVQGGLVLQAGHAYDSIVGKDSHLHPGIPLVKPSDADSSWIVRMISPDPAARDSLPRMPLASLPLTANQIATIVNWVRRGALRN